MLNTVDTLTKELLSTKISELIPQSVLQSVKNPEQLDIVSLYDSSQILNFIIVEHNYGRQTDPQQWQSWLAKTKINNKRITWGVDAPKKINRLHEKFKSSIENGKLSISDRILLTCQLQVLGDDKPILFIGDYDGEKGKGFATDFYTNSLPILTKKLGLRIVAGLNKQENISYFTNKLGRYTCAQLKPKQQQKLFPSLSPTAAKFFTIQFVYPEDIQKYVREDQIKA